MMDVHETFAVAIDALRSNKLRTILTSLGVIIGSASIVLVVTVALTSQKFVVGQIEAIGSNLLWVELVGSSDKAVPQSYEMTLDDLSQVKSSKFKRPLREPLGWAMMRLTTSGSGKVRI